MFDVGATRACRVGLDRRTPFDLGRRFLDAVGATFDMAIGLSDNGLMKASPMFPLPCLALFTSLALVACESDSESAVEVVDSDATGELSEEINEPSDVADAGGETDAAVEVDALETDVAIDSDSVETDVADSDSLEFDVADSDISDVVDSNVEEFDAVAEADAAADAVAPADVTVDTDATVADAGGEDVTFADTEVIEEVVTAPRLALAGPDGAIADGADDAGQHEVYVAFTRAYVITNRGDAPLLIEAVTLLEADALGCELNLASEPAAVVAPGESSAFDIELLLLAEGAAGCAFVIDSNDPTTASLRVDIAAVGTPSTLPAQRIARAYCSAGQTTILGGGITSTSVTGTLTETLLDGSLVTTAETFDNCVLTTQVGTLPGGRETVRAADSASCGTLSCTEGPGPNGTNRCRGVVEGTPYDIGASVTMTIDDPLLDGPVSHMFTKAPGFMTLIEHADNISRSAPLSLSVYDGITDTFTQVRIQQDNTDGTTIAVCEFPAKTSPVTIPSSILQRFHDGAFRLYAEMFVRHVVDNAGYRVEFTVLAFSLPQKSAYTFAP